jgi:GMP synthase (glutamine-hydrolysing)
VTAHILIVDGAPGASQDLLVAAGGRRHGPNYAEALASQAHASVGDVETFVLAAADGASLPQGMALSDFDGIAWTGSPLNAYHDTAEVTRQIEFARAAFLSGIPCFGSCWGLQVMMVALGGKVRKNPNGVEMGVARSVLLTEAGRAHPMYAGKPMVFDALCVHQDEVCELPQGAVLLAGNAMSAVQAASLHDDGRSFWGVQYHPEYDLLQIGAMFRRSAARMVERKVFATAEEADRFAADLRALHDDPSRSDLAWRYGISRDITEPDRHRLEFANWLRCEVAPRMQGAALAA